MEYKKGHIPWSKGKKMSEETRKRMSESKKGKKFSEKHRINISEANKGRKCTEETRKKIGLANSIALKGNIPWNKGKKGMQLAWNKGLPKEEQPSYGRVISEETKKKISQSQKGKIISSETRQKLSDINKGKKLSEETKRKMGDSRRGEKNCNWIEDRSRFLYPMQWDDVIREGIRQRDGYICQECGIHNQELSGFYKKLDIHHIDYNKKNLDPKNLISLCRSCHMKTNTNREYWINYFNKTL